MWRMKIKFCARFPHNSKGEVWSLSATPPPSDVTRVVLIYRYQKNTSKRASLPKTRTAFHNLLFQHRCEICANVCALQVAKSLE